MSRQFNLSRALAPVRALAGSGQTVPRLGQTVPRLARIGPGAVPRLTSVYAMGTRTITTSAAVSRGIMPGPDQTSTNPGPTNITKTVIALDEVEFHQLSDKFLEDVLHRLEKVQDERTDVEVEFSSGVLSVTIANNGTYVINKQPPNRQIWLSSPISGPARFDWVVFSDGQHEKEGTASAGWINSRTGGGINDVFLKELGIDLSILATEY